MNASLRAFLAGLIDYAGLFPPAALSLEETVRRYARDRAGRDAWMLGRLVVPASKIGDLLPLARETGAGRASPLPLSALAGIGREGGDRVAALESDIRALRRLCEEGEGTALLAAVETKLPENLSASASDMTESVAEYLAMFAASLPSEAKGLIELWVEIPPSLGGRSETAAAIEGIRTAESRIEREAGSTSGPESSQGEPAGGRAIRRIGCKLRCGGESAGAVPSVERVAFVLAACRDAGIPLKCTAGLHHPARRRAGSSGGESHGFLSVLAAAVLAHANGWPEERIASCVSEEDARAFVFDDDALAWRGESASVERIERARRELATGFGSCSFDEPREDLAALGWMEPAAESA